MDDNLNLKPCPFCGGAAEVSKTPNMWIVECNNAGCGSNPDVLAAFKHDAITAWNRRSADASGAVELPPLPRGVGTIYPGNYWTEHEQGRAPGVPFAEVYTAEQVRQAQREAVAADRAAWQWKEPGQIVGRKALTEFIEKYCGGQTQFASVAESAFYWFNKVAITQKDST